jgi:mono/diheme cytochrome c family protein
MYKSLSLLGILLVVLLFSFQNGDGILSKTFDLEIDEMSFEDLRISLGADKNSYYMGSYDAEKSKLGLELIKKGRAKRKLFNSKAISSYFVCTDCHNLTREFENATDQDPESRLAFAQKNNLPFLPASTFWGIYNRQTFYNDDYIKKYGEIIIKAKNSLPESIQVCAKYCSSGRFLKDWELEAIMHYFKENELRLKDLGFSNSLKNLIAQIKEMNVGQKRDLLKIIDNSYIQGYSAHFAETMPRDDRNYGVGGNVQKGKYIYEKACLHCHLDGRVAFLKLDNDKLSAQMFLKNKTNYSDLSLYQIIRQGTYAMPGRNQYMPRYTKDKMSDQQAEDLMAYLNELAEK